MTERTRCLAALVVVTAAAAFGASCGGEDDVPRAPVTVMTRNLYLGADLTPVVFATALDELRQRVSTVWDTVQASDFPGRAKLIADEVAAAAPQLVGLQEVSLFRLQTPGDFAAGDATPNAQTVALDFLAILMNELAARNLDYRVAVEAMNGDAELPGGTGDSPYDLRLTDRDVVLVRSDVDVTDSTSGHFSQNLTVPVSGAGGISVTFVRGFEAATATVAGTKFRFMNSHLEVAEASAVQEAQAMELVARLHDVSGPLVLVGDFNSAAGGTSTRSYATLSAELNDAYARSHPGDPGVTCCNAEDLRNAAFASSSAERIDLVLHGDAIRAVGAQVVGTDPARKTASGVWPSDHAGVVATVAVPLAR